MLTDEEAEYFRQYIPERVEVAPISGCWIWTRGKSDGYGVLGLHKRSYKAYRVAYEAFRGPIPEGVFACHACDVPACVNPWHIFLGTLSDNARDAFRKGVRLPPLVGETHPSARLTAQQALEIFNTRDVRSRVLAEKYGVSPGTIQQIWRGANWKGVTGGAAAIRERIKDKPRPPFDPNQGFGPI